MPQNRFDFVQYFNNALNKTLLSRMIFGYVGDVWLVNGIVFSGIGAALSGLFCIMSDAMTSFAEQCIFVILLGIVQGKKNSPIRG